MRFANKLTVKKNNILLNRITVEQIDVLSCEEYPEDIFYLIKSESDDSAFLICQESEKLKDDIYKSANIYSFFSELQKVSLFLLFIFQHNRNCKLNANYLIKVYTFLLSN